MKNPVAYEWYNLKTGHCYVDYIRHPDLEFDGEYTKTPLYKIEQPSAPVSANYMQIRDLTDEEWMKLPKEEILQLYKNCYNMLLQFTKWHKLEGNVKTISEPELNEYMDDFKSKFSGSNDYMSGINDAGYSLLRKLHKIC